MYVMNQNINRVTDYGVNSILKNDHNLDPSVFGSKQLEHELASKLLPVAAKRIESVAVESEAKVKCEVVGDRDIKWTQITDKLDEE